VIGFTARLLEDDPNAPKYINTPQTLVYDKSRHVFGLHLAKESIRKEKYAVIAEGNLDVIMSHQAGVRQVVATAGTALTEWQLKALGRFTPDIRLSFDADRAGIAATERAIPIASKVGVSLSVIDIPSGKDPDELIKQDPNVWREIISKPKYALDWLIERYKSSLDLNSAIGKRQFSDILLPIVRGLSDSVEQDHYLNKISELMQISRQALTTKMTLQDSTLQKSKLKPHKPPERLDKNDVEMIKKQDHLLVLVLLYIDLRKYLDFVRPEMFVREEARNLYEFLQQHPDYNFKTFGLKGMQNLTDYANILLLQYEELYRSDEPLELMNEAARLQSQIVKNFVKYENQNLAAQLDSADQNKRQRLLELVNQNNALLKAAGGTNG
jgi:DNA primase